MEGAVRVGLLGPFEVRTGDRVAAVAGNKLQTLLAMLALAAPQPVSVDRLTEELWGDEQPGNPANALQALVSQLRRLLGRDTVTHVGGGYALGIAPEEVDVGRLTRLVHEGRDASARGDHAGAVRRFRAAVELVRGPPLAELDDRWFAREASARLEDLVLGAHEGLLDGELTMGRHADVVEAVAHLVERHPLRERFRVQLITALYRCGRQADALQAYRDARDHLVEELGLDPSTELQAIERAVLAHDPALAAPIALSPLVVRPVVPAPLTSFVGRRRELPALRAAVDATRLTTIVGPGGVGKTRLALELVRQLADEREVWFVELAPVVEAASVAETIAIGLGAPERACADGRPPPSPERRAADRLGTRDVVVVIDNCEHVVAAAASCALVLLAECPGLHVVTTSREPLGVEGERQFAVAPLDDEESAELFAERARAVQPMFDAAAGSIDDQDELIELCRHLDGLPLAIELAAARTKTLPVPEIVDRLRDRFALLRREGRGGPARHDGLEAAIDWSYDLLFEDERRMLRLLSVFSGGATIEAAEEVCGPDAFELATRLVDRSLLVAERGGRAVRLVMLESVRAYGLRRLQEGGELDEARAAHLRAFTRLAERVEEESTGRDQLDWLARLDDEHDNLRTALADAVDRDPEGALRLVAALLRPWWFRGRRHDARLWLEASLAAGADAPPRLRAAVLAGSGLYAEPPGPSAAGEALGAELHHELAIAERRQREALTIYLAAGDVLESARVKLLLLVTLGRRAAIGEPVDRDEVAALVREATAVFDRSGDDYGSAMVRAMDGTFAVVDGAFDRAVAAAHAAQVFARRIGDRFAMSRISYVLGMVADVLEDPGAAYRHIEHGLRLVDELRLHRAVTAQARLLAPLADRCGERELAAQWRTFLADRGEDWTHFDGTVVAAARNREGLAARAVGDLSRAERTHTAALEWYTAAGLPAGVAFSESCLGFLASQRGAIVDAALHHGRALSAAIRSEDGAVLALAVEGCASVRRDPAAAVMLLAGAAVVRAAAPPTEAATHRDDIRAVDERAHATLGAAGHDAARAAGAALDRHRLLLLARHSD